MNEKTQVTEMKNDYIFISNYFDQFKNLSAYSIGKIVGINHFVLGPHVSVTVLLKEMFKYTNTDQLIEKHKKSNLSVKTVRLQSNNTPKESMSFEVIDFQKVVKENWKDSFIRSKFLSTHILFVTFQFEGDILYFKGIKLWHMPNNELENDVRNYWSKLQSKLIQGVTLKEIKQKSKSIIKNDLPSTKDNRIMHTRPKAADSNDRTILPDGQLITKQAYWFNASYIGSILSNMSKLEPIETNNESVANLTESQYNLIKENIELEIYTIEDFLFFVKTLIPKFDLYQINKKLLDSIDFKIHPPYIFNKKHSSVGKAIENLIFKNSYFKIKEENIYNTDIFQRYLTKLEKSLSIIKVDKYTYITKPTMEGGDLTIELLEDYQSSVLNFISDMEYFSYKTLKNKGFNHSIEELGFEQIFFESIIKQSSYLKTLNLGGIIFYKSTNRKIKVEHFFNFIIITSKKNSLKINEIIDIIEEVFFETLSYDYLDNILLKCNKNPYYSSKLGRLFINQKEFLKYIS